MGPLSISYEKSLESNKVPLNGKLLYNTEQNIQIH